jgi:predicted membrane protein
MSNREQHWNIGANLVLGLAFVAFGVLFFLDNIDVLDAHTYVRYWPLFLIIPGLFKLFQPGRNRVIGAFLVALGAIFLLNSLDLMRLGFHELWPLILVMIGASILWGHRLGPQLPPLGPGNANNPIGSANKTTSSDPESFMTGVAVLGGYNRSNNSKDFRGADLTAVLGGCEIDLRQADIAGSDAVINVFAFWGGIKLRVPAMWRVSLQGVPILGGFDDKSILPSDPQAKRLVIKGTAVMGGVEITN